MRSGRALSCFSSRTKLDGKIHSRFNANQQAFGLIVQVEFRLLHVGSVYYILMTLVVLSWRLTRETSREFLGEACEDKATIRATIIVPYVIGRRILYDAQG